MTRLTPQKVPALLLGVIVSVTGVAIAAGWASDPVVGTWKLNASQSRFSQGPAMTAASRTYEESRDGTMRVTLKSMGPDGKEITSTSTFKEDGKDYPVSASAGIDSITETRINARTAAYTQKKGGKVMLTGRRVLSKDGKRLTVTETGIDDTGTRVRHTLVYDRQ